MQLASNCSLFFSAAPKTCKNSNVLNTLLERDISRALFFSNQYDFTTVQAAPKQLSIPFYKLPITNSSGQSIEEKTSPLRPFPSFPVAGIPAGIDQSRFLPVSSAQQSFPYFPHQFGHHGSSGTPGSPGSMEAALRLPDFPFPGGLAAFCKYTFFFGCAVHVS